MLHRHIELGQGWNLGLFTWNLADNRLIGDETYASIYGFDPYQLVAGVTIEDVLSRVFEDDREQAARETHNAITSGRLTSIFFRVRRNGVLQHVNSFGRCLRDTNGIPHIFSGGVQYRDDATMPLNRVPFVQSRH